MAMIHTTSPQDVATSIHEMARKGGCTVPQAPTAPQPSLAPAPLADLAVVPISPRAVVRGSEVRRTPDEERQVLQTWEVVAAAQAGDTDSFALLYDRYVDMVFRYILFRVNDRSSAEDLTSETFLRALRRITSITYQGKDVGAWFVTIARNLVLDHVKSSRHRLEFSTAEMLDSDSTEDPEGEVIAATVVAELIDCVRQLGDDQRECIVLRFFQGLSVSETAAVMGRNDGAVKALQHRAVRRLAKLLPSTVR